MCRKASIGFIKRGMPAKLTVQDLPGRMFDGYRHPLRDSLDLSTRTMLTEIDFKNPQHELYPGMYANVTLQLERHPDAIEVPDSAIGDSPDGKYVMVAEGGKLRRQAVTIGITTARAPRLSAV